MKFVKGMNDSFESVRSRVLTTFPLQDMNAVFNMSITHERHQGFGNVLPLVTYDQAIIIQRSFSSGNTEAAIS